MVRLNFGRYLHYAKYKVSSISTRDEAEAAIAAIRDLNVVLMKKVSVMGGVFVEVVPPDDIPVIPSDDIPVIPPDAQSASNGLTVKEITNPPNDNNSNSQ